MFSRIFGKNDNPVTLEKLSKSSIKYMRKAGYKKDISNTYSGYDGTGKGFYEVCGDYLSSSIVRISRKKTFSLQSSQLCEELMGYSYIIGLYHAAKKLGPVDNWSHFALSIDLFDGVNEKDYWRFLTDKFSVSHYVSQVLFHISTDLYSFDDSRILSFIRYYVTVCDAFESICYLRMVEGCYDGGEMAQKALEGFRAIAVEYAKLKSSIEDGISSGEFNLDKWNKHGERIDSFRKQFK